jgi:hypothetical protein
MSSCVKYNNRYMGWDILFGLVMVTDGLAVHMKIRMLMTNGS